MATSNNIQALTNAGLITSGYEFTADEQAAIESLSADEVQALISAADKLGKDFLAKSSPHGLLF
jgi:hypothetical protein